MIPSEIQYWGYGKGQNSAKCKYSDDFEEKIYEEDCTIRDSVNFIGCSGVSTNTNGQIKSKQRDYALPGGAYGRREFHRVVIVRLKYGTDILEGLNEAIQKEKIKNAVILNGVGSLTRYHTHVVSNTTFPTTHAYVKKDGPVDLLNVNGYIIDGRVHAHITVSDDKEAIGGHLEDDTRVFTFAIITIGVLDERITLERFDDNKWR